MRLLLDTHIFLWAVQGNASLKPRVRRMMEAAEQIYVSAASIWEIAIKARLGRPDFPQRPTEVIAAARRTGFTELAVHAEAAARVADLPLLHRDPFDRLLVAQAIGEPARLYTADPLLPPYSELVNLIA